MPAETPTAGPSTRRSAASLAPNSPSSSTSTLARSAASAGAATMTSRILGVVREQVLAALFGAGNAMDAYNVAYRIPNLVRDLFAEGAMSSAFVPTFTRHLATSGKESAWRLANYVINGLLVITGLLVVVGIVFAEPLVELFAGAFRSVPGKIELTVFLTRIMLPFLSFVAVAAACMGMLNSLHRFFIPALSPAMYNVATITCAFALVPLMPALGLPAIAGIAIGSLLGGAAQLAIQWPALRREGFAYRPMLDWRDESVRRVLVLMGPGTIGLAATQVNVFVNTVLATGEGTGAVSWLNYAFRLMYLPIGLFGISIATATLPAVSRHAAQDDEHNVRRTVADGLSLMIMLNVPATVGLLMLASPIVQVIFERGAFTSADTVATAAALQFYALGLVGYSIVRIASPVFYALGENFTPVKISIAAVIVNALLNIVLVRLVGYRGLALGTSIAALLNAALLMAFLRKRLGGLDGRRVAGSFVRIAIASLAMAVAVATVDAAGSAWLPGAALVRQIVRLGASMAVALAVLAAAAHVLHIPEFREGVAMVARKFGRTAQR
ncbi:MAG: murein biosynthesis integral membrane protein MurJ [Vicinamibacterales bacterium]